MAQGTGRGEYAGVRHLVLKIREPDASLMLNRVFAVLAYGAALALGMPSVAHSSADKLPSVVVRYSDLDVRHEAGARALLGRLWHAAHHVCAPEPDIGDLKRLVQFEACVKDSMDRAVSDAHVPLVSALYAGPEWIAQNSGAAPW